MMLEVRTDWSPRHPFLGRRIQTNGLRFADVLFFFLVQALERIGGDRDR